MSVHLLVYARSDLFTPKMDFGDLVAWSADPFTGAKEGLPNYVQVHVTNGTVDDANAFLSSLKHLFQYGVLAQSENGKRYRIEIDSRIVNLYGDLAGFRQQHYQWLQEHYGAVNVIAESNPPFYYVLDFPFGFSETNPDLDNALLKREFEDIAVQMLDPHRYYFSADDVQTVIDAGGFIELTKAQVNFQLQDKLNR